MMKRAALLLLCGAVAAGCTGMADGSFNGGGNDPGAGNGSGNAPGNGSGSGNGSGNGAAGNGSGNGSAGNGSGNGAGSGSGNGGEGNGGGNMGNPPSAQVSCPTGSGETTGKRVLRRLTGAEYEATVRAAFGFTGTQMPALSLPPDPASLDGFNNNVDRLKVGPDYAQGVQESARKVAALVSGEMLTRLLPCASAGGPPCAQTYVNNIGPKLYRRPLTPSEQGRYLDLYTKVSQQGEFKDFVYWATVAMLQSPNVIYRSEIGEAQAGNRYRLTQYELASALSYTFTGGPPSADLMQRAAGNQLSTPDQLEAAARSLVFDAGGKVKPEFREIMLRFADQWIGLSTLDNLKKDATAFPAFNEQIQGALGEEARRFLTNVLVDEKGGPADLFQAPYTFLDSRLAGYYGYGQGVATGSEYVKVDRPAGWGLGLLAQGAMLAVEAHSLATSPTKRGYFVRTRVLCGHVPPPPAVVGELPEPTEANTTRERYEKLHLSDASCKACHALMDPIGFGFEKLDAVGRYRTKEGRFDIDDSGSVADTSAGDLTFVGANELATKVAGLPEVATCMSSYLASYAFGVNQPNAACLVRAATDELKAGMSVVDFYVKMARSEHFRTRQ